MTDEIVLAETQGFLAPAISVKGALQAYQAKKDLIDSIMKPNVDYGIIPGTTKNTLLKAGAEKATSFFGLSPRFRDAVVIEDFTGKDHDGEPFFFYRRNCELWRGDYIIAAVDGSCNSFEKKYRYRNAQRICPSCQVAAIFQDNKGNGGFYCWNKKGGCGAKFAPNDERITKQEAGQVKNPDIADVANTVLKMADKRALVAATLIATGLSEYFTQDVEDFITGEFVDVVKTKSELRKMQGEVVSVDVVNQEVHYDRKPAAKPAQAPATDEHKKLIAEWSVSFNSIPLPLRGSSYPLKNPSQATDEEISKAIAHNKQLAIVKPDELKIYNQNAEDK